jgi:hypothetical protein
MGYVKITDPNIIDISAWQQLINTVNQHSDSITALTNSFNGTSGNSTDWNADSFSHVWDPGSQAIVYGKVTLTIATNGGVSSSSPSGAQISGSGSSGIYYGTATFSDPASSSVFQFSSHPVVTATLSAGASSTTVSSSLATVIITVNTVTTSGFNWRITGVVPSKAGNLTLPFYWTAVGPR